MSESEKATSGSASRGVLAGRCVVEGRSSVAAGTRTSRPAPAVRAAYPLSASTMVDSRPAPAARAQIAASDRGGMAGFGLLIRGFGVRVPGGAPRKTRSDLVFYCIKDHRGGGAEIICPSRRPLTNTACQARPDRAGTVTWTPGADDTRMLRDSRRLPVVGDVQTVLVDVEKAAAPVVDLVANRPGRPLIVAVDGASAARTSTLAAAVGRRLNASVVAGDDFYRDLPERRRAAPTRPEASTGTSSCGWWRQLRRHEHFDLTAWLSGGRDLEST
jgi:hypothetical protein